MFKKRVMAMTDPRQLKRGQLAYSLLSGGAFVGFGLLGFTAVMGAAPGLFLGLPIFMVSFLVFAYLVGLRRQRLSDLKAQAIHDAVIGGDTSGIGPFILYLRPFDSTGQIKKTVQEMGSSVNDFSRSTTYELEAQLVRASKKLGTFIGLGQSLEHQGAGRIETTEADWQASVLALAKSARLIVMVPVANPGTLWELEQVLSLGYAPKTLFLNVPGSWFTFGRKEFDQKEDWPRIQSVFAAHGYTMPTYRMDGRMLYFGRKTEPIFETKLKIDKAWDLERTLKKVDVGRRSANLIEA